MKTITNAIFGALLMLLCMTAFAEVPESMTFQGYLTDTDGEALDGSYVIVFTLYNAATDGDVIWQQTKNVEIALGVLNVELGGAINPLDANVFSGSPLWIGIRIGDDEELAPRQPIASAPYASRAQVADNALSEGEIRDLFDEQGYLTEESDPTVNTLAKATLACAANEIPKWDGNSWICAPDIDTVDTNTDLLAALSCESGQVPKWDGNAWICAADENSTEDQDTLGGLSCLTGEIARFNGADWECDVDLVDPNTDTLADLECAENEIAKWTGTEWACAIDIDTTDPNTDTLADLECAENEVAKWTGTEWACATDIDTTDPNTDTLADLECAENEVPKWTGTEWACATDIDTTDPNTDTLADLECAENEIAKWTGTEWTCATDENTTVDEEQVDTWVANNGYAADDHNHDTTYVNEGQTDSVTSSMIVNGTVAAADLAESYSLSTHDHDLTYVNEDQADSITSSMIVDGTVAAADLADGAALGEILDDDGAGSGLDADLLDGQQGSYYQNASNITAGTLSTDRFSAYSDLLEEGILNNDSNDDLLIRSQADARYPKMKGESSTLELHIGTSADDCSSSSYYYVHETIPAEMVDMGSNARRHYSFKSIIINSSTSARTYYLNGRLTGDTDTTATFWYANMTATYWPSSTSSPTRFAYDTSGSTTYLSDTCINYSGSQISITPSSSGGYVVVEADVEMLINY